MTEATLCAAQGLMDCRFCGSEIDKTALVCPACGRTTGPTGEEWNTINRIKDFLNGGTYLQHALVRKISQNLIEIDQVAGTAFTVDVLATAKQAIEREWH